MIHGIFTKHMFVCFLVLSGVYVYATNDRASDSKPNSRRSSTNSPDALPRVIAAAASRRSRGGSVAGSSPTGSPNFSSSKRGSASPTRLELLQKRQSQEGPAGQRRRSIREEEPGAEEDEQNYPEQDADKVLESPLEGHPTKRKSCTQVEEQKTPLDGQQEGTRRKSVTRTSVTGVLEDVATQAVAAGHYVENHIPGHHKPVTLRATASRKSLSHPAEDQSEHAHDHEGEQTQSRKSTVTTEDASKGKGQAGQAPLIVVNCCTLL